MSVCVHVCARVYVFVCLYIVCVMNAGWCEKERTARTSVL